MMTAALGVPLLAVGLWIAFRRGKTTWSEITTISNLMIVYGAILIVLGLLVWR